MYSKKCSPPPPQHTPLTPAKSKVFSRRKSHQTTAIIFSRPLGDRGATTEEGKLLKIFFLIATGRVKLQLIQAPISVTIMQNGIYFRRKICRRRTPSFIREQHRKWSADRKWSPKWAANDPRPQVIPKQKIYKYISKIIAVEQQCSVLLTCWLTYCSSMF